MSITKSQTTLINHLKKKDKKLTNDESAQVVASLSRYVILVQKLYTQPQAEMLYKDRLVDGKKVKTLIINTNIEELAKVKSGPPTAIGQVMRKLMRSVTQGKK